jgi:HEAT repeat protein
MISAACSTPKKGCGLMMEDEANIRASGATAGSEACSKTNAAANLQALLALLIKAKKDLLLYPAGNAMVTDSLERLLQRLRQDFPDNQTLEIHVEKDHLSANGIPASTSDPRIAELSLGLYERGVQKIVIDPSIPLEEMKTLLRILSTKVEDVASAGGIEKLIGRMEILHAVVESTPDLMIVEADAISLPPGTPPWLEALDGLDLDLREFGCGDQLSRLFMRVKGGDPESFKPLLALLRKPEVFSELLEKFNLRLQKLDDRTDQATRVERLVTILSTVGAAIASVASQDKRSQTFKNLAFSVLGLSSNLKAELIHHGLMPNLASKNIEAEIVSRFPVTQLADVVLENYELSGGTASVMHAYFANLDLSGTSRMALAELLRTKLKDTGKLTQEVEAVLKRQQSVSVFLSGQGAHPEEVEDSLPRIDRYPPEKILFQGDERARLMSQMAAELKAPIDELMVPTLGELMRYEQVPANHAPMVARAASLLDHLLQAEDYEKAAVLLRELKTELEEKRRLFSSAQLEPLKSAIEEFISEGRTLSLIGKFVELNKESPKFTAIVRYLEEAGENAIATLARALEYEESRRVRILICRALADMGEKSVATVVGKLDHPKWYVVRNAISILGRIASPVCISHLRKALSHEDIRVRKEALKGLASIRTDEAIDLVCGCVKSDDPEMCRTAAAWVAAMQSDKAVPAISQLLNEKRILKLDDDIIRLATEALGAIESEAATNLLMRLSRTQSVFHRRKAAFIRESARCALHNHEEH